MTARVVAACHVIIGDQEMRHLQNAKEYEEKEFQLQYKNRTKIRNRQQQ